MFTLNPSSGPLIAILKFNFGKGWHFSEGISKLLLIIFSFQFLENKSN